MKRKKLVLTLPGNCMGVLVEEVTFDYGGAKVIHERIHDMVGGQDEPQEDVMEPPKEYNSMHHKDV
jgi:hypothetical protein